MNVISIDNGIATATKNEFRKPRKAISTAMMLIHHEYFDEGRAFGSGTMGWYILTVEDSSQAAEVVRQTEATIRSLTETISEAARSASQIVAAAGQQATGMSQISQSMAHIDDATRQTLTSMRESEQSAKDLNDLGARLKELTEGNGQIPTTERVTSIHS